MAVLAPEWLRTFRVLHECAGRGELKGPDLRTYRDGREVLASVLLAAQQVALPSGHAARRSLRVARALQVDIERNGQRERAPALDVSASGFAAWVATPLEPGDEVTAAVALPSGKPVHGQARVVRVEPNDARNRSSVGFQFLGLTAADWERLETFVFDAVLEHIK